MHTFFWSGPFSQWHKCSFVVDGIQYNCAEQFMMHKKALLFGDTETAERIVKTTNPLVQKQLGRRVRGFDADLWNHHARAIVYEGNYAKFSQNDHLRHLLLDTSPTFLVEASPYDRIWGIGLDEETARRTPKDQWPGKNWLGQVLTYVRDDLLSADRK